MSQPRRALPGAGPVSNSGASVPRKGQSSLSRRKRPSSLAAFARRVAIPALAVSLVTGGAALSLLREPAGTAVPATDLDVVLRTARSSGRTPLPGLIDSTDSTATPGASLVPSVAAGSLPSDAPVAELVATSAPVAQATPEPEAPAAQPDFPAELAPGAGTQYAKTSVNVRQGPGTDYSVLDTLGTAAAVSITEATFDGWRQVDLDGAPGWVKASYLVETKPAPSSSSSGGGSSSGGIDTLPCSRAAGAEDGLTSRTLDVLRAVCNAFPSIKGFGGARGGSGSYHNSGRAVDVMVSGDAGWAVAKWARANASSLGIIEVLYSQKIWTTQRSGEGWRSFSDRGSDTANHYDHVHISVR